MSSPLRNLPVAQKLFVSFGVLCALMVAIGVTGLAEVGRADQRLEHVYRTNLRATGLIGEVRADVQQARALTARLILHSPAADVANIEQSVRQLDAAIDASWRD